MPIVPAQRSENQRWCDDAVRDDSWLGCDQEWSYAATRPDVANDLHAHGGDDLMSFGAGIHRCVGAALSRMEIKVTAREIITLLTDFELGVRADEIRFVPTVSTHLIAELPLRFKART